MMRVRAGDQDWLAIWRQMYDAERAQGEAATDPEFERHADHWRGRAGRYAAASRRQTQPDSFMIWLTPQLRPGDRVLDVGAGTGRYLPYLARQVAEVIAVEPSVAMRSELEQTLREAETSNVRVLAEDWPLAQPLAVDVVISAHVVYGVREIGPFLEAMNTTAGRLCVLFLGLKHPASALAAFWERVHQQARLPLPGALETLAVCHQLGLAAHLDLVPAARSFGFPSAEEALEDIRLRLRLSADPARDAAILAAMADLLVPDEAGGLIPRQQASHSGVVWWPCDPARQEATTP